MSSSIRSLEEAAERLITSLKPILDINTICITLVDHSMTNRVIQSYSRQNIIIPNGMAMPLFPISEPPHHPIVVTTIANMQNDYRTSASEAAKLCGIGSITAFTIFNHDCSKALGSICLLNESPIELTDSVMEALLALSSMYKYMIELENDSLTDSLTGLYNRRYLSHLTSTGSDKQYSVLFIDIDDFKEVNDRYGHDTGDALLQEVAERLRALIRKSDVLVRYGGDEFLVCLHHVIDSQDMTVVSDKIKLALKQPYLIDGQFVHIYASVGISSKYGGGSALKKLISDADQSMYVVKSLEKNH
ncbi:GGDEF domain-containing protein [Paenibacillus sp. GCM10027627]|uniref:GGDEF domain-containing protein n=1 Tax=unclassified Paenibacillus TaxID=185978 RepID=UPI0036305FCA